MDAKLQSWFLRIVIPGEARDLGCRLRPIYVVDVQK